jgi:hypothetical protein
LNWHVLPALDDPGKPPVTGNVAVATMESKAAGSDKSFELGCNSKHTKNKAMEQIDLHGLPYSNTLGLSARFSNSI